MLLHKQIIKAISSSIFTAYQFVPSTLQTSSLTFATTLESTQYIPNFSTRNEEIYSGKGIYYTANN